MSSQGYHRSWEEFFSSQKELLESIEGELFHRREKAVVFPPEDLVFNAFAQTPLDRVKIVLLGQDPYHGRGEAHGLSFSVEQGVKMPPSLRNIFKELQSDLGLTRLSTDLSDWAHQGVLLINSILTVEEGCPGSHESLGWERFTDGVITYLAALPQPILFIFWGNYARKKAPLVVKGTNTVLEGVHPSPLSAYRGFFGSQPFSHCNTWLGQQKLAPIAWED